MSPHFWISRKSATPIREQISAQLLFGIVSQRLGPSQRLPSVRDLARRLKVHPNTVSAAYQDLASRGWVKRKVGSGVYVNDIRGADGLVRAWIEDGIGRGFTLDELSAAFDNARTEFQTNRQPRGLMVIHPDRELARILAAEIEEAIACSVVSAGLDKTQELPELPTSVVLTTTSGMDAVSRLCRDRPRLIALKSIEELVSGLGRPATPVLIGIVSRSETILKWVSLLIPILGLAGSDLIQRNPSMPNWHEGLAVCDLIAADVLAARELAKNRRIITLRLVSDSFLDQARRLVTAQKP